MARMYDFTIPSGKLFRLSVSLCSDSFIPSSVYALAYPIYARSVTWFASTPIISVNSAPGVKYYEARPFSRMLTETRQTDTLTGALTQLVLTDVNNTNLSVSVSGRVANITVPFGLSSTAQGTTSNPSLYQYLVYYQSQSNVIAYGKITLTPPAVQQIPGSTGGGSTGGGSTGGGSTGGGSTGGGSTGGGSTGGGSTGVSVCGISASAI